MWNEQQKPSQTRAFEKFQDASMEDKILPSPSGLRDVDTLAASSRKRKSIANNGEGTDSGSAYNFRFAGESNLHCNADSMFGINIPGNTLQLSSNQSPQSLESISFWHRSEKDQNHRQNDLAATWQTCNDNFLEGAVEKIRNYSSIRMSQYLDDRGPLPLCSMPVGGIMTIPNQQTQKHNTFRENEAQKLLHFLQSCNSSTESEAPPPSGNHGRGNHIATDILPSEVCNPQSDSLRPLELLQLGGKACFQEATNSGNWCDMKQSEHSFNQISTVGRAPLGVTNCTEQNESGRMLQSGNVPSDVGLGDKLQDNDKGHRDEKINVNMKTERVNIQNSKQPLIKGASPLDGYNSTSIVVEHGQRDGQSHSSLKSDEKSKSHSEKVAPTSAEKLWDGSLQLSSSVTVSAHACFKSGEKMPDVRWPEFVEVEGKVKLGAFEKYIQDLPRSRTRGLMVISLCWKEGSPETGLAGMKEVAKGYIKGKRIGVAPLSPGVDLYICPRSDTIITILAKYGFFKGMAAVEDNQDSLIGCVVWRRNQASSSSVGKNADRKNQSLSELPSHSPSDSSTQGVAHKNSSLTQPSQNSSSIASTTGCTTPESAGNSIIESKSVESGQFQLKMCNSSTNSKSLLSPMPGSFPSISMGFQNFRCSDSSSLQGIMGRREVESSLKHSSEVEKIKDNFEHQKPVQPLISDVKNQLVLSLDDDDLPEFDFNTACRTAQAPLSKPLNAERLDRRIPAEGFREMGGFLPPSLPIIKSENSVSRVPVDANQGMPLANKVCQRQSHIPYLSISEENHVSQIRATMASASAATAFPPPMNLFNDDDDEDMPEWCPPSLAESTRPSAVPIHSKFPNSTFESSSHGPPGSLLHSASPAVAHFTHSSQHFPRGYNCPTTMTVKTAQLRPASDGMRMDPNSSRGFDSNPGFMPPFNQFDVNVPNHYAHWRGWRPC